jgi:hypothetical protein
VLQDVANDGALSIAQKMQLLHEFDVVFYVIDALENVVPEHPQFQAEYVTPLRTCFTKMRDRVLYDFAVTEEPAYIA